MSQSLFGEKHCKSTNVQAFFDNELDASANALMRAHISECSICSAELRALQHLNNLIGLAFGFTKDLTSALQRYPLVSH